MKNRDKKRFFVIGNKKEEKVKDIGIFFILIFSFLVGKYMEFHNLFSYLQLFFILIYIFILFVNKMIVKRQEEEEEAMRKAKAAMNLFLGSYKKR